MPTRNSFLATRLLPASNIQPDVECSVCTDGFTNPVKVPCPGAHIFCCECITEWLQREQVNSCPLCRTQLFTLPLEEYFEELPAQDQDHLDLPEPAPPALVPGTPQHRAWIQQAVYSSGLQDPFFRGGIDTFGLGAFSEDQIISGSISAAEYLMAGPSTNHQGELTLNYFTQGGDFEVVRGPAVIDANSFIPSFIAMAHLIPQLTDMIYSDQDKQHWKLIVERLGFLLIAHNGKEINAGEMATELLQDVTMHLHRTQPNVGTVSFLWENGRFPQGNAFRLDLEALMDFVSYGAWKQHQSQREARLLAQQIRRRPVAAHFHNRI